MDLCVYDLTGRRVRNLESGIRYSGGEVVWNGCDENGARLPSGTYIIRLTTATGSTAARALLLK
jgi:flagellar hook assembly protein FlgD